MMQNDNKVLAAILKFTCILPVLFILSMFLLHLALPVKTYSKEERRYLAQWPVFHIEKITDGSYEAEIESYFSDQFPMRHFWVHVQHAFNQLYQRDNQ